jgi:hypothetical protein
VTEIELKAKYGIYSTTNPIHRTIATGDKEDTFTTESRKVNRGLEDLKIGNASTNPLN